MESTLFEKKIGFDRIRDLIKNYCISELGKDECDLMNLMSDAIQIQYALSLADEFKMTFQLSAEFPTGSHYNLLPALESIRVEGSRLDVQSALQLKLSLETIYAIHKYLLKLDEIQFPNLRDLTRSHAIQPFVIEKLQSIFNRFGQIQDSASADLSKIRKDLSTKLQSVQKRIHQVLKEAKQLGIVEMDTELSMRDGRLLIPVPSGNKRKIKGFIHDESATGKTSFVEPAELFELNNEIRELELAEQREISKIMLDLSDFLRPYLPELKVSYYFLAKIDFIRAKALFAANIHAIKPPMVQESKIEWTDAVHPLLLLHFRQEKKTVVPLSIKLDATHHLLLISGPNAGGKSVCLKTVGLIQYMFQCGLLVPVKQDSEFGVFTQFFVDIGDEQSIDNDLSTYSSHLNNLKGIIRNADSRSLVLLDEFGAGTEPLLGGAIAEAILEDLVSKHTFGVITTHYTNLKHFALSTPGILNGAMLYDQQKMEPLFQLSIGKPGSSFAFEIARKIGLPEAVIQRASTKVGQDYLDFDRLLKQVSKDKKYWENKRKIARTTEKELSELAEKYRSELEYIEKERKKILKESKEEVGQILLQVNKKIEQAIREIREEQADKEKTRKIRADLEAFTKEVKDALDLNSGGKKLIELKAKEEANRKKLPPTIKKELQSKNVIQFDESVIRPGDKVKLLNESTVGDVMDMNEKNLIIAFGNLLTSIAKDKVVKISQNEFRQLTRSTNQTSPKVGYNVQEKRLNFKHTIDVRGMRVDEAVQAIALYIDDCISFNVTEVKILHGTGNGVLRHHLREFLKVNPLIVSLKDD
jgi:DNA mismatch repair protein MutS2